MLKMKPIKKTFFPKPSQHILCITFPHDLLTSSEQQSKIKLDHVGPYYSQNKVSTPSFVMIIRLCQCSICNLATTVRARASDAARAETMQHSKDVHKYVPSTCNISLSRYPMNVLRPDSSSARKNGLEKLYL
jgi:hypothetical protein